MIPVVFIGAINSQRVATLNQHLADELNLQLHHEPGQEINLAASDSKEAFELDPAYILFVEALQNYVVVHYQKGMSSEQKILRNTLSSVESHLHGTSVQRSHRSFLVNRNHIAHVEGNAQGLRLTLKDPSTKQIPVSRRYISNFQ